MLWAGLLAWHGPQSLGSLPRGRPRAERQRHWARLGTEHEGEPTVGWISALHVRFCGHLITEEEVLISQRMLPTKRVICGAQQCPPLTLGNYMAPQQRLLPAISQERQAWIQALPFSSSVAMGNLPLVSPEKGG